MSSGRLSGGGVADRECLDRVRVVDEPLGAEEARGELLLVAGGVRIVTATSTGCWPGPAARMASGSSPLRRSSRSSTTPARYAVIVTRVAWRSMEIGCVSMRGS